MPYDISLDEQLGVTRVAFTGTLDRNELLAGMRDVRATPGHGYRTLVVVTADAKVSLSNDDTRTLATALRAERTDGAPLGRNAVIVESDLVFGLARMVQAYWQDGPSEIRVFHDEEEGRTWLASS